MVYIDRCHIFLKIKFSYRKSTSALLRSTITFMCFAFKALGKYIWLDSCLSINCVVYYHWSVGMEKFLLTLKTEIKWLTFLLSYLSNLRLKRFQDQFALLPISLIISVWISIHSNVADVVFKNIEIIEQWK